MKKRGTHAECSVSDHGGSPDIIRSGHGLTIVRQLARTLGGEVELRFGQSESVALLSFPISTEVQDCTVIAPDVQASCGNRAAFAAAIVGADQNASMRI